MISKFTSDVVGHIHVIGPGPMNNIVGLHEPCASIKRIKQKTSWASLDHNLKNIQNSIYFFHDRN